MQSKRYIICKQQTLPKKTMIACIAKNCARTFLRDFTKEEDQIIVSALYNTKENPNEIIAKIDGEIFIRRSSMERLRPCVWLNDKIIKEK